MKNSLLAGASTFAHLLGRGKAAASDEGEDIVQRDDESDEDFAKRQRAADEEEDKKREGETDDEHKARVEGNKAKRAKRADSEKTEPDDDESGDDESDGNDMKKKGVAASRRRERARCAAIFADAAAGKNPALAAQLAFGTDLPRNQAIKILQAGGLVVARPTLDQRMGAVKVPPIGPGDSQPSAGATEATRAAAAIIEAGKKRRGEI